MPETADKIFAQLGSEIRDLDVLNEFGLYKNGTKVTETPEILFARIDAKEMDEKIQTLMEKYATEDEKEEVPGVALIDIDEFFKSELTVCEVINCEKIKKAKKLLKFTLNDGKGTRTVVSGIAKWYEPEELIGKHLIVVSNLKPVTLCGVESQGMILPQKFLRKPLRLLWLTKSIPAGAKLR